MASTLACRREGFDDFEPDDRWSMAHPRFFKFKHFFKKAFMVINKAMPHFKMGRKIQIGFVQAREVQYHTKLEQFLSKKVHYNMIGPT